MQAFVQDYGNPFTHQFIQRNNLTLFIVDSGYLLGAAIATASAVYFVRFGLTFDWMLATFFGAGGIITLALCVVLSVVSTTRLQTRIAYEYALLACVAVLGGTLLLTSSIAATAAMMLAVVISLGYLLYTSK